MEKHYNRGRSYSAEGKYEEAIIEFRNVLQLDSGHVNAKYQLALIYMKKGGLANLRSAFRAFSEVVELEPDFLDAQVKLGGFYLLSNDLKKAQEKADLVLEKAPDNKAAQLIQARLNLKKGETDQAEKIYKNLLRLYPEELVLYQELSELYLKRKSPESAESI